MLSDEARAAGRRDERLLSLLFGVGFVGLFLGVGAALVVESLATTLGLWPATGHARTDLVWGPLLLTLGATIAYRHLDRYRHRRSCASR